MAENPNLAQASLTDGMSKLMEAARANMTAYNLAAAGLVALTAGAVAYMWDQSRRNAFLEGAQHFADQMRQAWGLPQTSGDTTAPTRQG
jgi:hypothetical protein